MKKLNEINNNEINFLDYARNYTFAVISGIGSVYCFTYGFARDKPSFIIAGLGALAIASLRAFNGYVNLKKLKRLCEENLKLKNRLGELEKLVDDK